MFNQIVLSFCSHSHRVSSTVGCGAFAPCDAESQPLVVSDQAGGEPLVGPARSCLQVEGKSAAPSLPWEIVILRPQRRCSDGVLWLHHTLPQHRHGNCGAGATESFNCCVMFCLMEVHSIDLKQIQGEKDSLLI